jgi:hypothetical protein
MVSNVNSSVQQASVAAAAVRTTVSPNRAVAAVSPAILPSSPSATSFQPGAAIDPAADRAMVGIGAYLDQVTEAIDRLGDQLKRIIPENQPRVALFGAPLKLIA